MILASGALHDLGTVVKLAKAAHIKRGDLGDALAGERKLRAPALRRLAAALVLDVETVTAMLETR